MHGLDSNLRTKVWGLVFRYDRDRLTTRFSHRGYYPVTGLY